MTTWALLAPGPSASAEQAEELRGIPLGAIGCAYQLAPWANFIASSDAAWWRKYPEALDLPGKKFCMAEGSVERVRVAGVGPMTNSGVLGLECAKREGATRILLFGFDMHGTHFFGSYTNGLRNTQPHQRQQHLKQFQQWAQVNKNIEVINCTPGSALKCFLRADPESVLCAPSSI